MTRSWEPEGNTFRTEWSGASWSIDLAGPVPGPRRTSGGTSAVLGLLGIADAGRFDPEAVAPSRLVSVERHYRGVRAVYRPLGWGGMVLSATWTIVDDAALDLIVHLQADSVDELSAVEVWVGSSPEGGSPLAGPLTVEPRDIEKGALSSDGREGDVAIRILEPNVENPAHPVVWSLGETSYVEMVQPTDFSRRIRNESATGPLRTALFGHALEKGVALRARLRGLWLDSSVAASVIDAEHARFLREPPPLGA